MDPITIAMALAQFAPQIVKWITNSDKAAEAAGTVVDIAKAVTGQQDGSQALETLKADPQAVLAFRQALAAQEADLDKAYLADRADARARDLGLHQAGFGNDRATWMIVGDVAGLVICILVLVLVPSLPGEVRGILSTIAGFFGLGLRDAHSFEFGSSRGSKDKDDALSKALSR